MKPFAFGLAIALTFSYLFKTSEALPMVCAWALYAWLREMGIQREEATCYATSEEPEEKLADLADVESDGHLVVRPAVVPPPLPRSMEDE